MKTKKYLDIIHLTINHDCDTLVVLNTRILQ